MRIFQASFVKQSARFTNVPNSSYRIYSLQRNKSRANLRTVISDTKIRKRDDAVVIKYRHKRLHAALYLIIIRKIRLMLISN